MYKRQEALCARYGMRATRNNLGVSHENGSIEARQGTIKRSIEQALLLRGTRDFTTLLDYRHFVAEVAMRLNARTSKALTIERACLQPLPSRRSSDYEEVDEMCIRDRFNSVKDLVGKIDHFVTQYNKNCKPFIWTATADSILARCV